MEMIIYNTTDSENVINKTLTPIHTYQIELKSNVSITTPTIILNNLETVPTIEANYCYLEGFNRFYFIRDIVADRTTIQLDLECDVLESFKNEILTSSCEYVREMKEGDYSTVSSEIQAVKEYSSYKSDVVLDGEKTIVLTSIGGS